MSRARRVLGGTGIAYVHQAAVVLLGLWLTPFLLARLGQQHLGLWLVAGQVLGYLALMDLGVIAVLPREVAFASGQPDTVSAQTLIANLIARVRAIVRWQVIGLSAVCAAVLWWLPAEWAELRAPLAIVFVAFVALYPARVTIAALQGLQELPFLSGTQLAGWILGTTATISLVFAGAGLYALVVGWIVSTAVPAVAAIWKTTGRWQASRTNPAPVGQYFQRSMWVSVAQVAQVMLNGSDVLLLARLLGPAAVVPYTCTGKLVTVFANHPQLLMHAAQPALSELRGSGSREKLTVVATALTHAMLMLSGALVVVILPINAFFVSWWVGSDQYGGWLLTVAFAAMMLLRHWSVAVVYTLFCFGYERQISLTSLAEGVVTVITTAILVWKWGPIGAPLGAIAGVVLVSLPMNLRSVAHELGLSVAAFLRKIAPLLIRILAVAAAAAVASTWWHGVQLGTAALVTLPIVAIYAALVFPIAWRGPVGPYLRMALAMLARTQGGVAVERQAAAGSGIATR